MHIPSHVHVHIKMPSFSPSARWLVVTQVMAGPQHLLPGLAEQALARAEATDDKPTPSQLMSCQQKQEFDQHAQPDSLYVELPPKY